MSSRTRWALVTILGLLAPPAVGEPMFIALGDLPGDGFLSDASGMSADGRVVVGSSRSGPNQPEPFRWTLETGMVGLGFVREPPASNGGGLGEGVSPDGRIVVGRSQPAGSLLGHLAFRWTEAEGMLALPMSAGVRTPVDNASAVSNDGSVIVGEARFAYGGNRFGEAAIWSSGRVTSLGRIPSDLGSSTSSRANGVSADGTIVIGTNNYRVGSNRVYPRAFIWTDETGMQLLTGANGQVFYPRVATYISPDGSVIVGTERVGRGGASADGRLPSPHGGERDRSFRV